ncbi:MAG: hypothetical protein QOJ86_290 [Bradyrhizobium sp.]|jgi:hypothetical protein|nr:hypothetical protein [Bradyrhizobium sp.]
MTECHPVSGRATVADMSRYDVLKKVMERIAGVPRGVVCWDTMGK